MELIDYLDTHFFTQAQLLALADIDTGLLESWQRRRMMPLPSYRLRLDVACDSFFGKHAEQAAADYYPKGAPAWIAALRTLDDEAAAHALFGRRYRERLAQLAASGFALDAARLGSSGHIAGEWGHFLAGTYGVCTVSGLPEEIAAKEAAIVLIRDLTANTKQALTDSQRQHLHDAVDLLDNVNAPFAPHEVARSSRRKYVDEVRNAYGL
jgi:hypothetical protein